MRYLRLAAILIFTGCLALFAWATFEYNTTHNTEPPVILSENDFLQISVKDGEEALKQGLTATDAQDGDVTDKILVSATSQFSEDGSFRVDYVVFDSHNNFAKYSRRVRYTDYTAPRFSLSQPLVFTWGQSVRFLNYVSAYDVIDGDITDQIKVIASNVSNYTLGTYPVLLEVTNSLGDTVQAELSVVIQERKAGGPEIRLREYLTTVPQDQPFDPYKLIFSVVGSDGSAISASAVQVLGSVDTGTPGSYQLIYSCTHGGQTGRTYLTVVVAERED